MNRLIELVIQTKAGFGNALLRWMVGIIFITHGSQKLFGLFGGSGPFGFSNFLKSIGVPYPLISSFLAANTEFFGGIAILIGFLTRLVSIPLSVVMLVAIFGVHWSHGFFGQNGGFEYPLTLLVVLVYFMITGAGSLSMDKMILKKIKI